MTRMNIYVSPNGSDQNSGSPEAPLKTLAEARNRVRSIAAGDIHVILRGGDYPVHETLKFTLRDGGDADKKITYEAMEGEQPTFSSAQYISGWRKLDADVPHLPEIAKDHVWIADIPADLKSILTLYDGNTRLERTHSDFFMPSRTVEYERLDSLSVANADQWDLLHRIDCPEGVLRPWQNVQDIEVKVMPVPWTLDTLPLERVDVQNHVLWTKVPMTAPMSAKPRGICIENVIDYLDHPGTWCTDTSQGLIYYWPPSDEPGDNILTPTLREYFLVEGDIHYDAPSDTPVRNLHFHGLTFKHGMRDTTRPDYKGWGIQHDWEMFDRDSAMVRFRGAEDCSVRECHFLSTSGTALRLDLHCQEIMIENNLLDDIGSMGILLCGYGPGTKDVNHHNTIRNNIVTRCGQVIWHGHGIFLWQSGHNIVSHNRVHHSARKGIGVCGVRVTVLKKPHIDYDEASKTIRWDEINATLDTAQSYQQRFLPYLHSRNNRIEYNEIYRVLEKLEDGSALNISGAGTGNVVDHNYVHHIRTHRASGAMRVDDWQCGTTFQNNIIYKCNLSSIIRKNKNDIINNIIADVNYVKGYLKFASYPDEEANYGSKIWNNIFYESGDQALFYGEGYLVSDEATYPRHCDRQSNIFYCAANPQSAKTHLQEHDEKRSKCVDPMFMNMTDGNFTLHPNSPALKMGFQPIDQSAIGLLAHDYPNHFLAMEYREVEDESAYDRGGDTSKTNYEWW